MSAALPQRAGDVGEVVGRAEGSGNLPPRCPPRELPVCGGLLWPEIVEIASTGERSICDVPRLYGQTAPRSSSGRRAGRRFGPSRLEGPFDASSRCV